MCASAPRERGVASDLDVSKNFGEGSWRSDLPGAEDSMAVVKTTQKADAVTICLPVSTILCIISMMDLVHSHTSLT